MRGKVSFGLWNLNAHGITPAYAGKSQFCGLDKNRFWDHPRVCGEKPREARNICLDRGSPPRMRGKDSVVDGLQCVHGITPAYAGKRACGTQNRQGWRDHPRVCGEKLECRLESLGLLGSPPRMRGKESVWFSTCTRSGITPAYAGKSFPTSMFRSVGRDHPRICGEKIVVSRTWCSRSGLPPRMRGKVSSIRDDLARVGITPAYAGKSRVTWRQCRSREDHPRICGEKRAGGWS